MSQLGLGLGLSNVSSLLRFSPLDLDPYLLFDTQSSMIGTLENPTLDLDPSKPDTLNVITATRAGVATYTDVNGNIATASADTVRVDYTQGAELTPTVFQRVGYTDFSSSWSNYNATKSVQPETLDGNAIVRWTTTGSTAQLKHNIDTEEGTTYTYSFYVRLISNDGGNQFRAYNQYSTTNQSDLTLDENWQKVVVTFQGRVGGGIVGIGLLQSGTHTIDNVLEYSTPQVVDGNIEYDFVANTTGSPKFITGATYGPRVPMILVEPSSENLVPYSEDFNTVNGSTKTTGIVAPDGSNNAERFSGGALINNVFANSKTASIATGSAVDYVGSIYVRGTAGETVNVFMKRSGAGPSVTSGSLSVLLTGEWQRIENLSLTTDPANDGLRIFISSSSETADSVDLWGAQVETGSVGTSVIPTSGSTAQRAADDLQIERDSTNLMDYSEDFSDSLYIKDSGVTIGTTNHVSPSGSNDATKVEVSDNGRIYANTTSGTYTTSVFIKSGTFSHFVISGSQVDLNAGTSSSGTIEQLANGWYRVSATVTTSRPFQVQAYPDANYSIHSQSGDYYLWGAQLETGDLTSYIPTSGAAASRTTFSDFFSSSEGTFYAESSKNSDVSGYIFEASSSVGNPYDNRHAAYNNNLNKLGVYSATGGVQQYSKGSLAAVSKNELSRIAYSYKQADFRVSFNGEAEPTPIGNQVPSSTIDQIHLGQTNDGSSNLNGHIKRLIYWPYHSDSL